MSMHPELPDDAPMVRALFIHHSTGRRLLRQGSVRQHLAAACTAAPPRVELWDQDYNWIGLRDGHGRRTDTTFHLPNDNTDPDGFEALFGHPERPASSQALRNILLFDVVILKSCFPVSAIASDAVLHDYQRLYQNLGQALAKLDNHVFVCLTPPPLIPLRIPWITRWSTDVEMAHRASAFADWLNTQAFAAKARNVRVFDLFHALAAPPSHPQAYMLRPEYRHWNAADSHPNRRANETLGPQLASEIFQAAQECLRLRAASTPDSIQPAPVGLQQSRSVAEGR